MLNSKCIKLNKMISVKYGSKSLYYKYSTFNNELNNEKKSLQL